MLASECADLHAARIAESMPVGLGLCVDLPAVLTVFPGEGAGVGVAVSPVVSPVFLEHAPSTIGLASVGGPLGYFVFQKSAGARHGHELQV